MSTESYSHISKPHRLRVITGIIVTLAVATVLPLVSASPVSAGPRWGCHAWVTSTGQPGGGVSGYCDYGQGNYRVVGLCVNNFTQSSWWVYGQWVSTGMSKATCPWYAHPGPNPYMQS